MNKKLLGSSCALCLGFFTTMSFGQSSAGNAGPSGGTSGVSGTATSGAGSAAMGQNGGKNTAGASQTPGAVNKPPSGAEFHPPTTSPGASQN